MFLGKPDTEENRAAFVSTIPLGRGSTPADVANACCYLASDEAEFITGVNLEVCFPGRPQNITANGHRSTVGAVYRLIDELKLGFTN